jgi:hypothetical protein
VNIDFDASETPRLIEWSTGQGQAFQKKKREVPNLLAKDLAKDSIFPLQTMDSIKIKPSSNWAMLGSL